VLGGFSSWGGGEKGEKNGGRGAWPRPAGGAPTASWPTMTLARRAWAARLCFGQGRAEAADGRTPVAMGAGVRGEVRAARVGRPEKKKGWSSPDEQYGFGFI
jgi:hypothetical protein